jgi:hypothetical protein
MKNEDKLWCELAEKVAEIVKAGAIEFRLDHDDKLYAEIAFVIQPNTCMPLGADGKDPIELYLTNETEDSDDYGYVSHSASTIIDRRLYKRLMAAREKAIKRLQTEGGKRTYMGERHRAALAAAR